MFRIKDFVAITAGMIAHMRAVNKDITDFNVGAVARTMVEAPAIELDELYQQMAQGLIEAIPTAIYRSFDFNLQAAVAASGFVLISCNPAHALPVVIPAGFLVAASAGIEYAALQTVTIPVGQSSASVLVQCTTAGSAGNTLPGTIINIVTSGSGAASATNILAFGNGRGIETEAERKLRFQDFVRSLARGTVAACIYGAKLAQITDAVGNVIERVARVTIEETLGHVFLYIYNGTGSTSPALVAAAQGWMDGYTDPNTGQLVPGYRPTGMRVDVVAMTEQRVDATILVQVPLASRTTALQSRIALAVGNTIAQTTSGNSLHPLDLVNTALAITPVIGAEIANPTLSVPCPISAVLVPGTIVVTYE